jgi:hypothetical protein
MIAEEVVEAREVVAATMAIYGETPVVAIKELSFIEEQVMGSWFPDEAAG